MKSCIASRTIAGTSLASFQSIGLDMCEVCTESSPFRSTLNMGYMTGLDMCEVCTESSPFRKDFWTGVTSQVWTCVKYVLKYHFEQKRRHMLRNNPCRSMYVLLNKADEHKNARNTKG